MKYQTITHIDYQDPRWSVPDNPTSQDFAFHVFGTNRSGTTLTCKVLEKLGIDVLYTESQFALGKDIDIQERGPKYLELSDFDVFPAYYSIAKGLGRESAKAIKMLIPMNRCDISFIQNIPTKVLICRRDFKEISASYTSHFGGRKNVSPKDLETAFLSDWSKYAFFAYDMFDVYFDLYFDDSERAVTEIAEFVGLTNPDMITEAIKVIDPNKRRFSKGVYE